MPAAAKPHTSSSHSNALKLIVHADDFGLSVAVNHGVIAAHLDGVLTSASIMANGAAFEEAAQLAKLHPSLDLGAHLTLIEEAPVLEPSEIQSLVGDDGRFHKHITDFALRYARGEISLDEVSRELEAQMRKIAAAGLTISHLDSHQHVHMLPGILRVTQTLARRFSTPWVRYPCETPRLYMLEDASGLGRVAQLLALDLFCLLGAREFAAKTDHFIGFYFGGRLGPENLKSLITQLPKSGVCELMCHPGLEDQGAERRHWGYRWQDELAALKDPSVRLAFEERGVALVSYRDLST
jgi:hopanoid biosynthesis associated protein HpnK